MALTYAILSVLADRPQTKAEIVKYFESSIGFFWKASRQQIYEELTKLEHQGWINSSDCQRYRLNAVGKQELIEWINEPCKPLSTQDDLLIKVLASGLNNLSIIRQKLVLQQQLHLEKLLAHHITKKQCFPETQELLAIQTFPSLTLQRGIYYEQEWIDWCDESLSLIAILEKLATQTTLSRHLN